MFQFVRVVRPSKLKRWSAILSRSSSSSPSLETLLDKIAESGGYSERAFGGCLFVALPADSEIDIDTAIALLESTIRIGYTARCASVSLGSRDPGP